MPLIPQPFILMLLVAIILFPKAGFYLGDAPINFSLLFLAIGGVNGTIRFLLDLISGSYRDTGMLIQLVLLGMFSVFSVVLICNNGYSCSDTDLAGAMIAIGVIPITSLFFAYGCRQSVETKYWIKTILVSLSFVASYGVFTFITLNLTKEVIGVPFVTFTGAEFTASDRHIERETVIKAVSTYHNGNLLGISMLMWFCFAIKHGGLAIRTLFRVMLAITISRTVWLGWAVIDFAFPLIRKHRSLKDYMFLLSGGLAVCLFVALSLIRKDSEVGAFIFDRELGGRSGQLDIELTWLGDTFSGIAEMVYVSVLKNFGLMGLTFFVLTWSFPLLTLALRKDNCRFYSLAVFAYLAVMAIDGAFHLFPTQFTFWFFGGLLLTQSKKNELSLPIPELHNELDATRSSVLQ